MLRLSCAVLVVGTALIQATAVAMFAVLSLQGDGLGIARAMALILAGPFVLFTLPAVFLLRSRGPRLAAALALLSLAASAAIWTLA